MKFNEDISEACLWGCLAALLGILFFGATFILLPGDFGNTPHCKTKDPVLSTSSQTERFIPANTRFSA